MRTPLLYKVYWTLRRGWKRLTPEARYAVRSFVASQKTVHGYMNAGGHEDAYYGQFGRLLEAVFTPIKVLRLSRRPLVVQESMGRDTVYGYFFAFIEQEMKFRRKRAEFRDNSFFTLLTSSFASLTTNPVCCILAMQHQMGKQPNAAYVKWLQQRQDETGGFYANEDAPVPDVLSTAVALFTLRLIGAEVKDATQFIQAHWLGIGGFEPTLYDDYSDVEYVFYGLLALGATVDRKQLTLIY